VPRKKTVRSSSSGLLNQRKENRHRFDGSAIEEHLMECKSKIMKVTMSVGDEHGRSILVPSEACSPAKAPLRK